MPSSKRFSIRYLGQEVSLLYPTNQDIAVLEGGAKGKFQETRLLECISSMGLEGVYVDVGANVGNHSIYFAKFTHATLVLAFEPHPKIRECLNENVKSNELGHRIRIYKFAAWDKEEMLWMDDLVPGNSGRSQIVGLGRFGKNKKYRVHGLRLEQVVDSDQKIVVMKFDVEDAEEQALRGSMSLIHKHHPVIVTEAHDEKYMSRQMKLLVPAGYRVSKERFDPRGETLLWKHASHSSLPG